MRPKVLTHRFAEAPEPSAFGRLGECTVALMLCLGLLVPLMHERDDTRAVVALADAERSIIVSLAGPNLRVDERPLPPAVTVAAAADEVSPFAPRQEVWPQGLRDTIVTQARALPQALVSVIGIASTYNPILTVNAADIRPTASGESYDADGWTAAIQIDLREQFGGVRYGRLYRAAFALIEHGHRRAIVKINDVGPLRPGRVIDLNDRAMRYFDPTMRLGLVHGVRISLLPGDGWTPGPVENSPALSLASAR